MQSSGLVDDGADAARLDDAPDEERDASYRDYYGLHSEQVPAGETRKRPSI